MLYLSNGSKATSLGGIIADYIEGRLSSSEDPTDRTTSKLRQRPLINNDLLPSMPAHITNHQ